MTPSALFFISCTHWHRCVMWGSCNFHTACKCDAEKRGKNTEHVRGLTYLWGISLNDSVVDFTGTKIKILRNLLNYTHLISAQLMFTAELFPSVHSSVASPSDRHQPIKMKSFRVRRMLSSCTLKDTEANTFFIADRRIAGIFSSDFHSHLGIASPLNSNWNNSYFGGHTAYQFNHSSSYTVSRLKMVENYNFAVSPAVLTRQAHVGGWTNRFHLGHSATHAQAFIACINWLQRLCQVFKCDHSVHMTGACKFLRAFALLSSSSSNICIAATNGRRPCINSHVTL